MYVFMREMIFVINVLMYVCMYVYIGSPVLVQWYEVPGLSSVSSTMVRGLRPSILSFWPFAAVLDPLYAQGFV